MQSTTASPKSKKQTAKIAIIFWIIVAFALIATAVGLALRELLGAIVASVIIAYIISPIDKKLEGRFSKTVAALLTVTLFFGSITAILAILIPTLITELGILMEKIPEAVEFVTDWINKIETDIASLGINLSLESLLDEFGVLSDITNQVSSDIVSGIGNFTAVLPIVALVPVLTFYILNDKSFFLDTITFFIPISWLERIKTVAHSSDKIVKSYIKTQGIVAVIVALATMLGYIIIGVPYAVILGLFMGACEIIPYFGPLIGAVPAVIIVLIENPSIVFWTVAVVFAVQQLEGNFISPYLIGTNFDINPLTVIIILWLFGNLFGFIGFIFAIPFYAVLRDVARIIFNKLVKSG